MATNWRANLLSLLVPAEGATLENFKLCRGDDPEVTASDVSNEVHAALMQKKLGLARTTKEFGRDASFPPVNVAAVFAA